MWQEVLVVLIVTATAAAVLLHLRRIVKGKGSCAGCPYKDTCQQLDEPGASQTNIPQPPGD